MNVIHEVGLFQGRLGFEKPIILLEEGCDEFSNVTGLGQIRFPAGAIGTKFEEIRRVLERESIITGRQRSAWRREAAGDSTRDWPRGPRPGLGRC